VGTERGAWGLGGGPVRLRYKVWLEHEELGKAFGDGPLEVLERVERSGSLRQAAAEMGMSYNKAWYLAPIGSSGPGSR